MSRVSKHQPVRRVSASSGEVPARHAERRVCPRPARLSALLILASAAPVLVTPARSQTEPGDTVTLDSIMVTVLRSPVRLDRIPFATSVLAGRDLAEGNTGLFIEEALHGLSGVRVQNRYNPSVGERISIRGFGARSAIRRPGHQDPRRRNPRHAARRSEHAGSPRYRVAGPCGGAARPGRRPVRKRCRRCDPLRERRTVRRPLQADSHGGSRLGRVAARAGDRVGHRRRPGLPRKASPETSSMVFATTTAGPGKTRTARPSAPPSTPASPPGRARGLSLSSSAASTWTHSTRVRCRRISSTRAATRRGASTCAAARASTSGRARRG